MATYIVLANYTEQGIRNIGDTLKVDTRTSEYIERVN